MLAQRCCGQQLESYLWLNLRRYATRCCVCCCVAAAVHGQLQQASNGSCWRI
jgi:hypothetical protein